MIEIKSKAVMVQLLKAVYDEKLIEILDWLYDLHPEFVFTCGFRAGDPGTHGTDPCRAVDLRSWVFNSPETIRAEINNTWLYDPDRLNKKVCKYHDTGSGDHFHIQVHYNTRRRL